jgi:ubiquinone/menaquinone biosynthesis C-methylase UbiE
MSQTTQAEPATEPKDTGMPDFDRLAGVYRWMEFVTFGPFLSRCRTAFLPELGLAHRALVIGDGDGRFTERLLGANPRVQVDAVDLSPAMLRALVGRAGLDADRVRAVCGDAREWQPAAKKYDLVVTHFFLDCLTSEEVRTLAKQLRSAALPGAMWVVSEFAIPAGWFGSVVARPVIWLLYRAFGMLTGLAVRELHDYRPALRSAGFELSKRRAGLGGLLVAEMWRIPGVSPASRCR